MMTHNKKIGWLKENLSMAGWERCANDIKSKSESSQIFVKSVGTTNIGKKQTEQLRLNQI